MNEIAKQAEFNVDFKPSKITIQNEEQLKELIDKTVNHYSNMVFTDESIPEAKKSKAELNKISKMLEDQRKAVKKEYSAPLTEFEKKIKGYVDEIASAGKKINDFVSDYEEKEKQKRLNTLNELIAEIAPNYEIEPEELETNPSWINKTSFTAKGELTKKTLEEVTFQMRLIHDRKKRIEEDKVVIGNYAKAVGLDPESWVTQIENGLYASDLMKQIDIAVIAKREREEREEQQRIAREEQAEKDRIAKEEYEQAMKELRERQVDNKTIDEETGEILVDDFETERQEVETYQTVTLKLTGTHEQLSSLNNFIVNEGIIVEVM